MCLVRQGIKKNVVPSNGLLTLLQSSLRFSIAKSISFIKTTIIINTKTRFCNCKLNNVWFSKCTKKKIKHLSIFHKNKC